MFRTFFHSLALLAAAHLSFAMPKDSSKAANASGVANQTTYQNKSGKITLGVMLVYMFYQEAAVWQEKLPGTGLGDLFAHNISIPGLSPLFPQIHCTFSGEICQLTTGESEINAAATTMALMVSNKFDLTQTYFLLGGIAGVNPKLGSLGSVAIARFAVQVALQSGIDPRELPDGYDTGYIPYDVNHTDEYPVNLYGTEVMEVSSTVPPDRHTRPPRRGRRSSAATRPRVMHTTPTDITYCMTAQEDNAVLQVLMRAAGWGLVDYSRKIVTRSGSNFDRPPPNVTAFDHLLGTSSGEFPIAIENMFLVGVEIVKGILIDWGHAFEKGTRPENYVGDIFGSLGGEPDFGPGSTFGGAGAYADANEHGDVAMKLFAARPTTGGGK
ncbi:Uu.00g025700.m01.CDS01 [Anthostomella pinea]|uniref:Uu.00g025700.m01.CDS01 n=1 Tax=Anthostomella pinea TaxID=933095 RepID=A0AAI8V7X0_9PEZI|nr:Uu.00g025700.m01.CDS01 [Anthostomella pinea]